MPVLCLHPPFHPVAGIVTDYLHCVLLGVTKMLLHYWFDSSSSNKDYYVGDKVSVHVFGTACTCYHLGTVQL